ncbi:MAG: winged helix-turn-helix domain-containing protein [Promethearchaeota archaeon]
MSEKNDNNDEKNIKNITIKQEMYEDIILEEEWLSLIDKHELRYEIWALLNLYHELNVTQISHLVKKSMSTVSRVLISMKKDGLVQSRRGEKKEGEGEKIPPKYYWINEKYHKKTEIKAPDIEPPTDPQGLREFYISEIKNYRNAIYNIHKLLDLLIPLFNVLEDQLDDIGKAKRIYNSYLSGTNEPWFNIMYFDDESYKKFLDIRIEYLLRLEKLAREQELDTKNAFVYLDASLPLKSIFELKKKEYKKN